LSSIILYFLLFFIIVIFCADPGAAIILSAFCKIEFFCTRKSEKWHFEKRRFPDRRLLVVLIGGNKKSGVLPDFLFNIHIQVFSLLLRWYICLTS